MGAIGFGFRPGRGRSGFSPAGLFQPGGGGAWYDPSDLAAMFQDAAGTIPAAVDAPIGRIEDKSGNGNHAVQATAAARPMLRQDGAGLRWLEYDGIDDCLAAATGGRFSQATLAAGFQIAGLGTARALLSDRSGPSVGIELLIAATGAVHMAVGDGSGLAGASSGATAAGVSQIAVGSYDGAVSQLHLNGAAQAPMARGLSVAAGFGLGVGRYKASPALLHFGRLYGAILLPRAASAAERIQIECWLAARSGVAL